MKIDKHIRDCNKRHGDVYDYRLLPLNVKVSDRVTIICPKHGEFIQRLSDHKSGCGCPTCGKQTQTKKKKKTTQHFKDLCLKAHNNRYTYDNWDSDINRHSMVEIHCPDHGMFKQLVNSHIQGHGCSLCANANRPRKSLQTYIDECTVLHNNCYDYSRILDNSDIRDKVKCEIGEFLTKHCINFDTNNRSVIGGELDLYISEYKLAIEYCGLYWHSEQMGKDLHYHHNKYIKCNNKDIQLLTIFEDEWRDRRTQVENKILSLIGARTQETIFARKCSVEQLSIACKKEFLNNNHIQGDGPGSVSYGLYYKDDIVAVVTFIELKNRPGYFYLNRYATSAHVPGGFSKLIAHFECHHNWRQIITFADLRWSNGKLYERTGFVLDKIIPPDFSYSPDTKSRFHKFNYRHHRLPHILKDYNPELSERKNCDNNGVYRIWDCGKMRFIKNNVD